MNIRQAVIALVVGIALGAVGAVYLPGLLQPYLPEALGGRTVIVKGAVVAKEKKPAVLLLTVNTSQGALLATFTRRVDETDLLVNTGDAVEIRIAAYRPFIEDPKIARVVKSGPSASSGPEAAEGGLATVQAGAGEAKPQAAGKPAPASPSRKAPRP